MSFRPRLAAIFAALLSAFVLLPAAGASAAQTTYPLATTPVTAVNLAQYGLVGRYPLPSAKAPAGGDTTCKSSSDTLADEASAVSYDPSGQGGKGSLFVVGDGGSCIVQTTLTGGYIDSMTLPAGNSPAGNAFYDTEGVTYVGQDSATGKPQLVMTEERYRNIDEFDYTPGTTLSLSQATAVKLGTTIGNIGLEGVTYDPATSNASGCATGATSVTGASLSGNFCQGFIVVKEQEPEDIFQTNVAWGARGTNSTDTPAGVATNGGATENEGTSNAPKSLFTPSLAGLNDFSDIDALSNVPSLDNTDSITGADGTPYDGDILIDSQASGSIEVLNRSGKVLSRLDENANPASGLTVVDETHEGVSMDPNGNLYVVSEDGGGQGDPELEVYAPTTTADTAPTAVSLSTTSSTLPSNTTTANGPVKLSALTVTDADGIGTDTYKVTATDANGTDVSSDFTADHTGLYVASGASLSGVVSPVTIKVNVSDSGSTTPSSVVTSNAYTLTVTQSTPVTGAESKIIISEVDPGGSGTSTYKADWFELTNTSTAPVSLAGWSADDSHEVAGNYPLNGVSSIAPGESVIFVQANTAAGAATTPAQTIAAFRSDWKLASSVQVGYYSNADGLSTGGDEVNVYDSGDNRVSGVSFGAQESGITFDNSAGINGPIDTFSDAGGDDGSYVSTGGETGSPGFAAIAPTVAVTEVDPAGSSASYKADWFELTNYGTQPFDMTGWTMDDSSAGLATSVPMTESGSSILQPGQSIIFAEDPTDPTSITTLQADLPTLESNYAKAWFPNGTVPSNFRFGIYGGSGVGLSTSGDGVTIFNATGTTVDEVKFGTYTAPGTFQNPGLLGVGASASESAAPALTGTSVAGVAGAFTGTNAEVGSPGTTKASIAITEIDPGGSGTSSYQEDWFELTNTGTTPEQISGWSMDDSHALASAAEPLTVSGTSTLLPAGASIVFAEHNTANVSGETVASLQSAFETAWFGSVAATPSSFLFGTYTGTSSVGLSGSGDAVNIYDSAGTDFASVTFGAATPGVTFDNTSGTPTPSVRGVKGARLSADAAETGSPGTIAPDTTAPTLSISGNQAIYAYADTVNITCTAADDAFGSGVKTPCTSISAPAGATYGAGTHTVTFSATDYAGNTVSQAVTFTVSPATVTGTTTTTTQPSTTTTTSTTPSVTPIVNRPVPGGTGSKSGSGNSGGSGNANSSGSKAKTVSATTGNAKVTVKIPVIKTCLAASAKLKVTYADTTLANSKAAKLTFVKATFSLDGKVRDTLTKRSATVDLSLKGLKKGSDTLKVQTTYHEKVGKKLKTVTRTQNLSVKVC